MPPSRLSNFLTRFSEVVSEALRQSRYFRLFALCKISELPLRALRNFCFAKISCAVFLLRFFERAKGKNFFEIFPQFFCRFLNRLSARSFARRVFYARAFLRKARGSGISCYFGLRPKSTRLALKLRFAKLFGRVAPRFSAFALKPSPARGSELRSDFLDVSGVGVRASLGA